MVTSKETDMRIEAVGFTGFENQCEIYYYDSKGDYIKTRELQNLNFKLLVNCHGNHAVKIESCTCTLFDDYIQNGIIETLAFHEMYSIEKAMTECVDWEAWELANENDVDDFLINE